MEGLRRMKPIWPLSERANDFLPGSFHAPGRLWFSRCVVTTDFLQNHPAFVLRLVEHSGREWEHLYDGWGRKEALREYAAQHTDGALPLSLVAMEKAELLGAVSLISEDLPGFEPWNPWLASLFVLPQHRGRGVAAFLVREAEKMLRQNGIRTAYLFTESAQGLFFKLGWQPVEETFCHGHPVTIFKKEFS